eukprot:Skav205803  [mRNA]  locus=scaffold307:197737:200424:- [translate_table: standard]
MIGLSFGGSLDPLEALPPVLIPPAYTPGRQVLVSSNAQNMARIWEERTSQQLGRAAWGFPGTKLCGPPEVKAQMSMARDASPIDVEIQDVELFFYDLLTSRWRIVELLEQLAWGSFTVRGRQMARLNGL